MTLPALKRSRRTIWSFIVILVTFLFIADGLIYTQQTNLLRTEMATHTQKEFDLLGKLISGSLIKGDYIAVEEAVTQWGEGQITILELKIISANGFTIANFKRDKSPVERSQYEGELKFGFGNTATITMVKDMSAVRAEANKLALQLISFSMLLVALLGFLLQRTAVRPLQQEITEREKAEEELQRQANELHETNMELEAFSYSLSHDLRTPLRSIAGFSRILQVDAREKLNAEEKDQFDRIVSASKYMAELIDDMIVLSRVMRGNIRRDEIDLTDVARATATRIDATDKNRKVDWKIEEGLIINGDKKLITLMFDNLFGNAWKYSSKTKMPRIEFATTDHNSEKVYFVKDNGIGFDMRYANKLFGTFQRLHKVDEFTGTGIGLATVQRIIHRHGGRIWAEAKEGDGATFFFTLPGF